MQNMTFGKTLYSLTHPTIHYLYILADFYSTLSLSPNFMGGHLQQTSHRLNALCCQNQFIWRFENFHLRKCQFI